MTDAHTQQPPRPPADAEAERLETEQRLQARMDRIGRKILVLSGKGGVGKSTVAANLAVALAAAGKTVGLLDADIHGPSIPHLLGIAGEPVGMGPDGMVPVAVRDNLWAMSIGLLVPGADDPVIWRGPRKFGAIRQFLADVAWGRLDTLVVDSPPGTGDEPLSVAQLVGGPAGAIIVTTPQDVAVADVRRCVGFCRAVVVPIIGVIENMSGYICPNCGTKVDLFGAGGGRRMAEDMNLPFLGSVPVDPDIAAGGDRGAPFAGDRPHSPAAEAFAGIVKKIVGKPQPAAITEPQHKDKHMKIAIPTASGQLCPHFGHCEKFAVLEADPETRKILGRADHAPPAHEPGVLPRWLGEMGVNVILASGMGMRAQQLFAQNGIEVVVGAAPDVPETLVEAYLAGNLATGENLCDH